MTMHDQNHIKFTIKYTLYTKRTKQNKTKSNW